MSPETELRSWCRLQRDSRVAKLAAAVLDELERVRDQRDEARAEAGELRDELRRQREGQFTF